MRINWDKLATAFYLAAIVLMLLIIVTDARAQADSIECEWSGGIASLDNVALSHAYKLPDATLYVVRFNFSDAYNVLVCDGEHFPALFEITSEGVYRLDF